MGSDIIVLIAIFVLLVASAFFSGSETALTGASRARIHTLEQQGDERARRVSRLWERRERVIGALANYVIGEAARLKTRDGARLLAEGPDFQPPALP